MYNFNSSKKKKRITSIVCLVLVGSMIIIPIISAILMYF